MKHLNHFWPVNFGTIWAGMFSAYSCTQLFKNQTPSDAGSYSDLAAVKTILVQILLGVLGFARETYGTQFSANVCNKTVKLRH